MDQRITKIEAHTEQLCNLLLGAHTVFAILRPMNIDDELVARLSRENRGAGFETIRGCETKIFGAVGAGLMGSYRLAIPQAREHTDNIGGNRSGHFWCGIVC